MADSHASTSEGRRAGLGSGGKEGAAALRGRGVGGAKAGKSGRHRSNVTGVEEDLKGERRK